jgi:transposase-like protein
VKRITDAKPLSKSHKRPPITDKLREVVWKKRNGDGEYGRCFVCDVALTRAGTECGHIVAFVNGGATSVENLEPVCRACNRGMGDENLLDYKKAITPINVDRAPDTQMSSLISEMLRITTSIVPYPMGSAVASAAQIPSVPVQTKKCTACGVEKLVSGFVARPQKDGTCNYSKMCLVCTSKWQAERAAHTARAAAGITTKINKTTYLNAHKDQIAQDLKLGASLTDIAPKYGCSVPTLSVWTRENGLGYKGHGHAPSHKKHATIIAPSSAQTLDVPDATDNKSIDADWPGHSHLQ